MSLFEGRDKHELDLSMRISPSSEGFSLTTVSGSTVREGEELLISFKTRHGEWDHVAINYTKGMYVKTDGSPEHVVIFSLKEVQALTKLSQAARSIYPENGFPIFGDPFSILNVRSPFHTLHLHDDPKQHLEKFDLSTLQTAKKTLSDQIEVERHSDLGKLQHPASEQDRREDRETTKRVSRVPSSPFRTDEVRVVPVVIVDQPQQVFIQDGVQKDATDFGYVAGNNDTVTVPFDVAGDKDDSSSPFGVRTDDQATSLFGGGRENDVATTSFASNTEPSAYN